MKRLWLTASAILMIGCEASAPTIDLSFADFKTVSAKVTYPEELPKIRDLQCYPGESDAECKVAGYTDASDIDLLETYKIRSEGNFTIAEQNAIALESVLQQANELVTAGRSQENITKIIQGQLLFSEQQREREKWYYRLMLVLVGAAGLYAAQ